MSNTGRTVQLGNVVRFKTGKLDSNAAVPDGKYPFFTCSQETLRTNTFSFDVECVLLGGNNAHGIFPLKYFDGKFDAYQRTYVLTPDDPKELLTRYLYYALQPKLAEFRSLSAGAATKFLTLGILNRTEIYVPRLPVQRRIVSILGAYDDLIEVNRQRIAILGQMARRLFDEWFVQFRFPGHERSEFAVTDGNNIPSGWARRSFSEIATFTNGYAFKPSDWDTKGKAIIKIKELKEGVTPQTPRYAGDLPKAYHIGVGDILFSWSADLDAYWWAHGEGWLNQHLFLVQPTGVHSKAFLFQSLRHHMPQFRSLAQGTTMKHIKRSALTHVQLLVPPASLQTDFDRRALPLLELTTVLTHANARLTASRDLLLPRLISGELSVATAERALDEVA